MKDMENVRTENTCARFWNLTFKFRREFNFLIGSNLDAFNGGWLPLNGMWVLHLNWHMDDESKILDFHWLVWPRQQTDVVKRLQGSFSPPREEILLPRCVYVRSHPHLTDGNVLTTLTGCFYLLLFYTSLVLRFEPTRYWISGQIVSI